MDLNTTSETISQLVTSGAVIIGGIWAYFKFIRGRTFAHRAELAVSAHLIEGPTSPHLLHVTVTLKNTGLSKLPLNPKMKALRLLAASSLIDSRPGKVSWTRLSTQEFFQHHAWLESQELASDVLLLSLPGQHPAYKLEAIIGSAASTLTKKKTRWISKEIVVIPGNSEAQESLSKTPVYTEGTKEAAMTGPQESYSERDEDLLANEHEHQVGQERYDEKVEEELKREIKEKDREELDSD